MYGAGRIIEEIGLKEMEHCCVLLPVLLAFLKDTDPIISRQSIVSGTHLFCGVLEEMALQVFLLSLPTFYFRNGIECLNQLCFVMNCRL